MAEYRGKGPITKNQLAALLKDYDIFPEVLHPTKRSSQSRRGYRLSQCEDKFARLLPSDPNTRTQRPPLKVRLKK